MRINRSIQLMLVCLLTLAVGVAAALDGFAKDRDTLVKNPTRQDFQQVTWMEEALFTSTYQQEPIDSRLARLEDAVYGDVNYQLSPTQRIQTLHHTLMERKKVMEVNTRKKGSVRHVKRGKRPGDLMKDAQAVQVPSAREPSPKVQPRNPTAHLADESDYPVLDQLENRIFGRTFDKEPMDGRLNRLDTKVFGQPQRGPYAARVDNLRLVVLGDTGASNVASYYGGYQQPPASTQHFPGIPPINKHFPYQGPYNNPNAGNMPVFNTHGQAGDLPQGQPGNMATTVPTSFDTSLAQAEQMVFKQTFPAEPAGQRLDRLETSVFSRTAPAHVSDQDRLERILAVTTAEGQPTSDRDAILASPQGGYPRGTGGKGGLKSLWPMIPMIILMLL